VTGTRPSSSTGVRRTAAWTRKPVSTVTRTPEREGTIATLNGTFMTPDRNVTPAAITRAVPAGVMFGPNARLNVPGSFHVSTAHELRFDDGVSFSALDKTGSGLTVAAPEAFGFLDRTPQDPEWHPEGDVWVHTLMVIDQARQRIDDLDRADRITVMLAAVTHDFGKPKTTAFLDGRIRSLNHEEEGVAPAAAFLDRLNVHSIDGKDVRRQVLGLTAHHLKPGMLFKVRHELTDGAFRRLAQKVDLELLARVAKSDCLGRTGDFDCSAMDWFLERARELGVDRSPPKPLLLGRHLLDLGVPPGPAMGELLKQVYERQLDGEITSTDDAIKLASQMVGISPQRHKDAE